MQRHRFKLAMGTTVLEKDQLRTMLSDKQFKGYNHARRCFVASVPLLVFAPYWMLGAFASFIFDDEKIGSIILFSASLSGVILISYSAIKLNRIAKDFNNHRQSSYFQNGLQLNYGLVGNGVGVSLRF